MKRKKIINLVAPKNEGSDMQSSYDALGSYTGTYLKDENEKPVQDADDL